MFANQVLHEIEDAIILIALFFQLLFVQSFQFLQILEAIKNESI